MAILVMLLLAGRPLFERVRVELVLAIAAIVIGGLLIGWSMIADGGSGPLEAYLAARGLHPAAYVAIVCGLGAAIFAVLATHWRSLPAILVTASFFLLADRLAQFVTPLADYLRSL